MKSSVNNAISESSTGSPILRAVDLVKEFPVQGRGGFHRAGVMRAVDQISFDLQVGETLAVVGESGSGKSTTARMIGGLLAPTSGRVELAGTNIVGAGRRELRTLRRRVQFVFQDPYSSLNPRHTVEEIVSAPARYQGLPEPAGGYRMMVKELLDRVGLNPDHSRRYPSQFSGGQAQRIGIARAIAIRPEVIICDEAVSALDVSVQAQVLTLLKDLQRENAFSYVFITHDLAVVRQVAHRIVVMHNGKIVETADRDTLFADPQDEYTKKLLAAVPRIS